MKRILAPLAMSMLLTGCSSKFEPSADQHYHLYISVGFSPAQADMIIDAALEWQDATGGFITFDGAGQPGEGSTIEFKTDHELQPEPGLLGETWNDGTSSTVSIYTSLKDSVFRQTAVHELGHTLGLEHSTPGTAMCYSYGCAGKHVTCKDVEQLCSVWGCNALAMPVCQTQ